MVRTPRRRAPGPSWLTAANTAVLLGVGLLSSSIPTSSAQGSPVSGTWLGSYSCAQGQTGLRLTIQNPQGNLLTATFAFFPLARNAATASGSFAMTGNYEGNRVILEQAHWINQPLGYVMVSLEGQVSGADFSGSIFGPGCSAFMVSRASPARVAIVSSGFSQRMIGSATDISFGVKLKNESLVMDAFGISVTAIFRDKYGRSVASESHSLTAIPAGKFFYYGGYVQSNVSLTVATMQLEAKTTTTRPKGLVLPPVSVVRVTSTGSEESMKGQLTNPYRMSLPSNAAIYAVFMNASGKIVGGAQDFAGAQVEPRTTVSFGFSHYLPPEIVSAMASVDPCDWVSPAVQGSDCPLTLPPVEISQVPGFE
jgi:hypothetical protein